MKNDTDFTIMRKIEGQVNLGNCSDGVQGSAHDCISRCIQWQTHNCDLTNRSQPRYHQWPVELVQFWSEFWRHKWLIQVLGGTRSSTVHQLNRWGTTAPGNQQRDTCAAHDRLYTN